MAVMEPKATMADNTPGNTAARRAALAVETAAGNAEWTGDTDGMKAVASTEHTATDTLVARIMCTAASTVARRFCSAVFGSAPIRGLRFGYQRPSCMLTMWIE